MNKKYDYEDIIELCGTGQAFDQALSDLQTHIKDLEGLAVRMQELFHGKAQKDIYKIYKNLFTHIGWATGSEGGGIGCWGTINNMRVLNNKMYSRAMYDKAVDEEASAEQSLGF